MLEQKIKKQQQAVVFFNLCFCKCLNKQYAAQSRVCFSAGRAFSLVGDKEKAETWEWGKKWEAGGIMREGRVVGYLKWEKSMYI